MLGIKQVYYISHTTLRSFDNHATRAGSATTVGGLWPEASLCDNVIVLSSLDHTITIGLPAMLVPNPLQEDETRSSEQR